MKKGGKTINLKIHFTNRWLYALIILGILVIVAVGVYAANYSLSGAGHPITEISTCSSNGQILKMSGGAWTCGTDTSCATSGACSQVCIGSTCRTSWPTALPSGWVCPDSMTAAKIYTNLGEDSYVNPRFVRSTACLGSYNDCAVLDDEKNTFTCGGDDSMTCLDYYEIITDGTIRCYVRDVTCVRLSALVCTD